MTFYSLLYYFGRKWLSYLNPEHCDLWEERGGGGGGGGLSPRLSSPDPGSGRQHPPPVPAWQSIFLTELNI